MSWPLLDSRTRLAASSSSRDRFASLSFTRPVAPKVVRVRSLSFSCQGRARGSPRGKTTPGTTAKSKSQCPITRDIHRRVLAESYLGASPRGGVETRCHFALRTRLFAPLIPGVVPQESVRGMRKTSRARRLRPCASSLPDKTLLVSGWTAETDGVDRIHKVALVSFSRLSARAFVLTGSSGDLRFCGSLGRYRV